MDKSTFEYLQPTPDQIETMKILRGAAFDYAMVLVKNLPEGADKTYCLRRLREVAMWANIAVTRYADGSPRERASRVEYEAV